ncbi:hypothetical protein [Noviherbaspirillum suwonense]|nr:hypothetical protein [Noviherbaspirillum suwonense]
MNKNLQALPMLNFSKDQLPMLSHGKRRAPEPQASGDTADIDSRPAKRPHLESPGQNQAGEPRVDPTTPVVRVLDPAPPAQSTILPPVARPSLPLPFSNEYEPPRDLVRLLKPRRHCSMGTTNATPTSTITHSAPQFRAEPGAPQSAGQVTDKENVEPVTDERFESIARQVRDAEQVDLELAIIPIQEGGVDSPAAVTVWLQFCAMLCLHYDDQQDKEPLWQCLERVFLRIRSIKWKCEEMRVRHDTLQATLLAQSMTAGFIRILQRAKASKWREGRLLVLFYKAGMSSPLTLAIEQMQAGQHPEKTARQAAEDFLLAHCTARAAHATHADLAAHAAVVPNPFKKVISSETVDPEFPFMPNPGEDMVDSSALPEFWWLPDGYYLAAHAFEPASESMSTVTTTTATTPAPTAFSSAPQLRPAPDTPQSASQVADDENVEPVDDERFDWIARQVRDARQVELPHAISTINEADFDSPPGFTTWVQLCAVLCLHYDDEQDKEPLWQCLERVLLRICSIKGTCKKMRVRHNTVQATLLAHSMPSGFIHILQRAKASGWREDRLPALFKRAGMLLQLTLAIRQMEAGLYPEKTTQQAAADFLLAHYPARAAHTALPDHIAGAVVPKPPNKTNRLETVNPEFLFMPFFGEDMIDPGPPPEFWWLPDADCPAAHLFEPASGSTSTTTTTTPTTPTPAVAHTAPQLRAAPDAPLQNGLVADVDNEQAVTEYLLND